MSEKIVCDQCYKILKDDDLTSQFWAHMGSLYLGGPSDSKAVADNVDFCGENCLKDFIRDLYKEHLS